MRLKKSVKRILIVAILLIVLGVGSLLYLQFAPKKTTTKAKVINEIKGYGYILKSNKSKAYQKDFKELAEILKEEPVDEEKYVSKSAQMFVLDFYSLSDKVANTDVGGTQFVHSAALDNFLLKAEDTIYKYVQNDMYHSRKQDLPTVDKVTIEDVTTTSFKALNQTDDAAYQVKVKWTYTKDNDYQNEATLIFIHEDKKLSLVEMQ